MAVSINNNCWVVSLTELTIFFLENAISLLYLNVVLDYGSTLIIWCIPTNLYVQVFNRGLDWIGCQWNSGC
jgi:hypothetical protein